MENSYSLKKKEASLNELNKKNNENIKNVFKRNEKKAKKIQKKDDNNFILQYSPRTEYCTKLEEEEKMYNELKNNFDPITIKIIKKHFKERLGSLKKEEMIAILKNHLLGFLANHPQREKYIVKFLSRLFGDIDLNDNGDLEWNEFTDYIIHLGGNGDITKTNITHTLKYYSKSNKNINRAFFSDNISYSFFIEKYNILGVVEENKSIIKFFDAKTYEKKKVFIDLNDIQPNVDLFEFSKLNEKANLNLLKEEEEKKIKKNFIEIGKMGIFSQNKKIFSKTFYSGRRAALSLDNKESRSLYKFRDKIKEEKRGFLKNFHLLNKMDINIKVKNKNLSVICACYIPEYDIIMISSTNNTITAWHFSRTEIRNVNATSEYKLSKDEMKIAILVTNCPQYNMIWDPQMKCLFTGQQDGKILKWELTNPNPIIEDTLDVEIVKKRIEKAYQNKKENRFKEESKNKFQNYKEKSNQYKEKFNSLLLEDKKKNLSVSCLIILKKLQLLAASYYNGYIILWDTLLKEYRKCYYDQSTGIYSLAYDSFCNLLFASGFNHDIYVYDPYIDCSSVYKLSGHTCSINTIEINEKENELISIDISGNIKIWDTSSLTNFQTIKTNEEDEDFNKKSQLKNKKQKLISRIKMIYFQKLKKIFIYGDKMLFYETNKANFPDSADDQAICACYYDYASLNLISFCLRKIKFWNLLTGKVRIIYDDPMGVEITAIAVDETCKRAYLGDNNGKIKNINLRNGLLLKNLESHNTEIKFLLHNKELNLVASCSIDNVIKIHNNKELLETEVIKEIRVNDNVTSLCFVNKYKRLSIGLSNGILKFYDIEHFHYDSDLDVDSSLIKGELTVIGQIKNIELVLCCYSNGTAKFIVTPPSNAKYKIIYDFNNYENNNQIAISCLEFDNIRHHIFLGDILGTINCYDISQLYELVKEIAVKNKKDLASPDPIIMKENIHLFKDLKIINLWKIDAHNESIRHIHYIEIDPRIIVTTSYDLKIKIFSADNGKYKDEFKQIANRMKPIPIGIKYYLLDPFGEKKNNSEPHFLYRKDLLNFNTSNINEENKQNITEVAKKITEYNAKEKLWLTTKNTNLPENRSNDWKLDINIDKIKAKEEQDIKDLLCKIKDIEVITKTTETLLLNQSIYSELYKPKYIEQMNDMEKIKELSKNIQDRLRNVKLAVSKANLNYNKMIELSKKQKSDYEKYNNIAKRKRLFNSALPKSMLFKNLKNPIINEDSESLSIKNKIINEKINAKADKDKEKSNNNSKILNKKESEKIIFPKNLKKFLPELKSQYALDRTKLKTPSDIFNKYQLDFSQGYKEIFKPFKKLFRKGKNKKIYINRVKSSIISKNIKNNFIDDDFEKENKIINNRKYNFLEKKLRKLEQNSSI